METAKRNKFIATLTSRKVWISTIGILVSFGVLNWTEGQVAEVAATVTGGITAILVLAISIEDGMRGFGKPPLPPLPPVPPEPVAPIAPTEPPAAA